MFSCAVVPRKYPKNTPFVYEYNINVEGNLNKNDRENIVTALGKQLDDSIAVRTTHKFFRPILAKPPVYKTENADKSVIYMEALMTSLGYFYDTITYDADTVFKSPDQYRTTVNFIVKTGQLVTIDSLSYSINHSHLRFLSDSTISERILKKGAPFAKGAITAEADRLVELYRNNGYMRFTREEIMGVWDTLDVALLQPNLDPFAQLEILQALKDRRNKKPTANLDIRLRPVLDSSRLTKYHVGTVAIFPDFGPETDSIVKSIQLYPGLDSTLKYLPLRTKMIGKDLYVIQPGKTFRPSIFKGNVYLRNGEVYSQRRSQRSLNRLNSLGAWRLVNIQPQLRPGMDTVDFKILLTPAEKYLFSANLEGAQNQTALAGSLFGIGVNVGVQNRNFGRSANLSNTNIRYGIELGDSSIIETQQLSFAYRIHFPRPFPSLNWIKERQRDNIKTLFSFNSAITERRNLFNLTSIATSLGYEFKRNIPRTPKSLTISITPINIEYSYLIKRQGLKDLIAVNPSLNYIFTDGFVPSLVGGISWQGGSERNPHIIATAVEFVPFFGDLISSDFLDEQLYRFVKVTSEYTKLFKLTKKTSLALRAFSGLGYEYNSTVDPFKKNNLPFFKQYFTGGPNSMRAWSLRKLGPGSSVRDFDLFPERYGDVQIEFNAEYRFQLFNIAGATIESALYTDIGNIWFLKKEASSDPNEVFHFDRFYKDFAVGIGTGLRIDFKYFLIRLDYAYKAKDPTPKQENAGLQNKWFAYKFTEGDVLQLGINYPFKL